MSKSKNFVFNGGAGSYLLISLFSVLVIFFTLGFGYPWAVCSKQRWVASNTYINGRQLKFTGGGLSLIALWIKWYLLTIITFGLYIFWMIPSLNQWIIEHTDFSDE